MVDYSNQPRTAPLLHYGAGGSKAFEPFYKHSGKVTLGGALLTVPAGLVVGAITGAVYAYAVVYIPFIKLNFIICMFFGIAIGAVCSMVLTKGKVRNVPVSLVIVFVITLVSYYVSWIVWIRAVFDRYASNSGFTFTHFDLVKSPNFFWAIVQSLNENGTWTLGSSTSSSSRSHSNTNGVMLWIIWGIEAATVFGASLITARSGVTSRPFCERCEAWGTKATSKVRFGPVTDIPLLRQQLTNHEFASLPALGRPAPGEWTDVKHQRCLTCNDVHMITVDRVKQTADKKGRVTTATKNVVTRLLASSGEIDQIVAAAAPAPTLVAPLPPPPAT